MKAHGWSFPCLISDRSSARPSMSRERKTDLARRDAAADFLEMLGPSDRYEPSHSSSRTSHQRIDTEPSAPGLLSTQRSGISKWCSRGSGLLSLTSSTPKIFAIPKIGRAHV